MSIFINDHNLRACVQFPGIHRRAKRLGRFIGLAIMALMLINPGPGIAQAPAATPSPTTGPTRDALRNWPQFRGPFGTSTATGDYPTHWDASGGAGPIWKSDIPLPGRSSPIVWDDKVFLSGASRDERSVFCFDAKTGKMLWKQPVNEARGHAPNDISDEATYAAPTPTTDGHDVFALFGTGDLACFDFAGHAVWTRDLGVPETMYALTSSPIIFDNKLIIQFDQGQSDKEAKSAIMALDPASGKTLWETKRPVASSWSTPLVMQTPAGTQLITTSEPLTIAYDPANGKELWRAECLKNEIVASPAAAEIAGRTLVIVTGGGLTGLPTSAKGEVPAARFAWSNDDATPDIVSPLAHGNRVWTVETGGTAYCMNAGTGKIIWQQDLDAACHASPVMAGGKIYLLDDAGVMHILDPGDKYVQIAACPLGEAVLASPAFAAGKIYIRGTDHLYCIGAAAAK